jgi:hypothetical protein
MQLGEGDTNRASSRLRQELGWAEGRNLRIDTGACFLKQKQ